MVNIVTESLSQAMNQVSYDYPSGIDKFEKAGLTPVTGDLVKSPLVSESPVNFECKLLEIMEYGQFPRICSFIIGEVVMAHIKDEFYSSGKIQSERLKTIGRLGTKYCKTTDVFELERKFVL